MTELTTNEGRTIVYDDNVTHGWTKGTLAGVPVTLYIRPAEHSGGGVFIKREDGTLHEAVTGEETVWFNNRLWTRTEEAELVERIKYSE